MEAMDKASLKARCFISQIDSDYYSCRIKVVGGFFTSENLQDVANLSNRYARGITHLTSRQAIEIPHIHFDNIENVEKFIYESSLSLGNCGGGIRTICACQGESVCKSGMGNTTELAFAINEKFSHVKLPHKFKIGITGCRNNCLKAEENDFGIRAAATPSWIKEKCTLCRACEKICPTKVISISNEENFLGIDKKGCVHCGKCINICGQQAFDKQKGFIVYFGGLFGNRIAMGEQKLPVIYEQEKLFDVLGITLDFFEKYANKKERFRNMLDRVGWDLFLACLTKAGFEVID